MRRGPYLQAVRTGRRAPKTAACLFRQCAPTRVAQGRQDRISAQEDSARAELATTEADLGKWQETLTLAIRLAGSCHTAYVSRSALQRCAPGFNQAVLGAVYIKDRHTSGVHGGLRGPLLASEFE
jgi:hypothetical protein